MSLSSQIALAEGLMGPGMQSEVRLTLYNAGAVAIAVQGVKGYVYTSGTSQAAPFAYFDGWGIGPNQANSIPAFGSLVIRGNLSFPPMPGLSSSQALSTAQGTQPANVVTPPLLIGGQAIQTPTSPRMTFDVSAITYTTGAGADAAVQSNTAQIVYGPTIPSLEGDGAWDTINGNYPRPAAAPGQLWYDRTNGYGTTTEAIL